MTERRVKHIIKVIGCRHYQELGFTIAEIVDILNGYSGADFIEKLELKKEEIRRRILEEGQSLIRIDEAIKADSDYRRNYGKYYIVESLHCMAMFYTEKSRFLKEALDHKYWDAVAENLNKFIYLEKISPKDYENAFGDKLIKSEGFSVRYEEGRKLGISPDDNVIELKPQRCLYTVCKGYPVITKREIDPIIEWISRRNMRVAGYILCRARGLSYEHGKISRFYDINIPIEE